MVNVVGQDNSFYKRISCRNCASILEYLPKDIKEYTHKDYGGGHDTTYYISCPSCNKQVTVNRY